MSASLVQEITHPVVRLVLAQTFEGRALVERLLGERAVLTPALPDAWREQTDRMIQGLRNRQPLGVSDEVYLRLLRIRARFQSEAPADSGLINDATEITVGDLELVQRLAAEELALRGPTLLERLRRSRTDVNTPIEFAPTARRAATYSGGRQQFLLGEATAGRVSAFERAITSLRELTQRPEALYMIFSTRAGNDLITHIYGPGTQVFNGAHAASDFVDRLAADPARRDLVIQIAFRLNRAVDTYSSLKSTMGLANRGDARRAVLERLASNHLTLAPSTVPSAVQFDDSSVMRIRSVQARLR